MNRAKERGSGGASPYDAIADWYDGWVAGDVRDDPYVMAAAELMGEVAGRRICDLACGEGRVARYLAERGASVVGIDLSARLLAMAARRERSDPRGIGYVRADARSLDGVADASFDGVLCHMALMDIADLAPTLRSVTRVLRLGGWFVFSILHPCTNTSRSGERASPDGVERAVARYFAEGWWRSGERTGPPGTVGAYHRTLGTYVNALADVGLPLERLAEPCATGLLAERRPVWAEVPAVLVARCRRSPSVGGAL